MNRTLLIVEDESDFVAMLEPKAKRRGYTCITDATGAETVSKALQNSPAAILLDMNLPDISGLGLIHELRKHPELVKTPIIVFSALNHSDIVKEAMARGANAYFTKGRPIHELFDVIGEYALPH